MEKENEWSQIFKFNKYSIIIYIETKMLIPKNIL